MTNIYIISYLPEYFDPLLGLGVVGKYVSKNKNIRVLNIAKFCKKGFKDADDAPYGGGPGMVMRSDILKKSVNYVLDNEQIKREELLIILTAPRGIKWNQEEAKKIANSIDHSTYKAIIFICGRYEGVDERFIQSYCDKIYSLGDYIISGGELAVSIIIDSSFRLLKDCLGNSDSLKIESFENNLLECPLYTRPKIFEDLNVPEELLSGNHKLIETYRIKAALELTKKFRPDLLKKENN